MHAHRATSRARRVLAALAPLLGAASGLPGQEPNNAPGAPSASRHGVDLGLGVAGAWGAGYRAGSRLAVHAGYGYFLAPRTALGGDLTMLRGGISSVCLAVAGECRPSFPDFTGAALTLTRTLGGRPTRPIAALGVGVGRYGFGGLDPYRTGYSLRGELRAWGAHRVAVVLAARAVWVRTERREPVIVVPLTLGVRAR